jgi:hypothetical protein
MMSHLDHLFHGEISLPGEIVPGEIVPGEIVVVVHGNMPIFDNF